MKCLNHLRFAYIIIAQWKEPVWLAVLQGNSAISVVVRQRKWGIAAVNTMDSLLTFPSPVLWPAYWSLFLTLRTSCPSPSLVREVTLWWSGEDRLRAPYCHSLFHLLPFLPSKGLSQPCFFSLFPFYLSFWCLIFFPLSNKRFSSFLSLLLSYTLWHIRRTYIFWHQYSAEGNCAH